MYSISPHPYLVPATELAGGIQASFKSAAQKMNREPTLSEMADSKDDLYTMYVIYITVSYILGHDHGCLDAYCAFSCCVRVL